MALIADSVFVKHVLDADIGGTSGETERINIGDYRRVAFVVSVGDASGTGTYSNWSASDALDTLKLRQHTAATGGDSKDITGFSLAQTAPNTAGEYFVLECRSEDVDTENGYKYVSCYVAETGNTATDNVHVTVVGLPRYASDNVAGATDAD